MVSLLQAEQGIFTVIGSLLAVIGVIIGSLLTGLQTSWQEKRRWEREKELRNQDERRQAYVALMKASWRLYLEINAIHRTLDTLVDEYDISTVEQTVTELQGIKGRLRDQVHKDVERANNAAFEIRLYSANEHLREAAIALAQACSALQNATGATVSLILDTLEGAMGAEYKADQDKRAVLKERFIEKQRHFIKTGREDLLGNSQAEKH